MAIDTGMRHRNGNRVLAEMSARAFALIEPQLSWREFTHGTMLWDAGDHVPRVYFPHAGLISLTIPAQDKHGVEVAGIGRESAAGAYQALDDQPSTTRAVVQVGGPISSLPRKTFIAAAEADEEIGRLRLLAGEWLLLQAQRMSACNATHPADARFARWLLTAVERTGLSTIPVTQEDIAGFLGIRRTTVTLIAQKLQMAGVIGYTRARITVRDRAALERACCSCCAALGRASWPSTRLEAMRRPELARRVGVGGGGDMVAPR